MHCEQARQLFDAYLDGELSAPLATELGAHRLQCADCRRALALLEVSGHIIASDEVRPKLKEGFSDRLLACMAAPQTSWTHRVRRVLYIAGPLAAAAVIALAFLGFFDGGGENKGAGNKVERGAVELRPSDWLEMTGVPGVGESAEAGDPQRLEALADQMEKNIAAKRASGESLERVLDLTVLQLLEVVDKANDASSDQVHVPGADAPVPLVVPAAVPAADDQVDD